MPLPKINTPTYELTLPSNRKKVRYRPFLVREEKILVLALESEDQKQITDAIIQIIGDCLITKNVDDISFLHFLDNLMLRIKNHISLIVAPIEYAEDILLANFFVISV